MKKFFLLLVLFLFSGSFIWSQNSSQIKIGIVEFEEKNQTGLENAGRIVAEWVLTELQNTGEYKIVERLMLQQVLEEQALMLSGIIDDSQVVEIGKIYGIDAIVTGSVMRIGSEINITARIINVQTAEVLKTASGTAEVLGNLERESKIIANNLADISREEFQVREAIAGKKATRLDLGAGVTRCYDSEGYGNLSVDILLRYQAEKFSLWIEGTPVPGIQSVELGGNYNLTHYLGIGTVLGVLFDNEIDYVETRYLLAGVVARPVQNIELGVMFGTTLMGIIWTESGNDVEVDGSFALGNYEVWAQYKINESYAVQLRVLGTELSDFQSQLPPTYYYPSSDYEYTGGKITLMCIYSFPI